MATLSVWTFPDAGGAERAATTLGMLAKQELISLHDAAMVAWPWGAKKPRTRQLTDLTGAGALGGSFWGLLFGLVFFVPLLGMAIGAGMGALSGSMRDVGIDDDFIKGIRDHVNPGTSALFVLTSGAVVDKVQEAFKGEQMQLVHTNLSNDQEKVLREVFAE